MSSDAADTIDTHELRSGHRVSRTMASLSGADSMVYSEIRKPVRRLLAFVYPHDPAEKKPVVCKALSKKVTRVSLVLYTVLSKQLATSWAQRSF